VGRRAAIVSPLAGTTRDVIEATVNVAGYPLVLADTAGLRAARTTGAVAATADGPADIVEAEGIQLAEERIASADLRLCVVAAPDLVETDALAVHPMRARVSADTIVVLTKADLVGTDHARALVDHGADQRAAGGHQCAQTDRSCGRGPRLLCEVRQCGGSGALRASRRCPTPRAAALMRSWTRWRRSWTGGTTRRAAAPRWAAARAPWSRTRGTGSTCRPAPRPWRRAWVLWTAGPRETLLADL